MSEKDIDPQETIEWLEAFRSVARFGGEDRAKYILQKLMDMAHEDGMNLPQGVNTAYLNSIPVDKESKLIVKHQIEHRIKSIIRWNAMIMVVKANLVSSELEDILLLLHQVLRFMRLVLITFIVEKI